MASEVKSDNVHGMGVYDRIQTLIMITTLQRVQKAPQGEYNNLKDQLI